MKHPLAEILESIEGNGTFSNFGTRPFVLPGLHVECFGEVSFPIAESDVKRLIPYAQKAPFGKGTATIMDTSIRSAWEIDAEKLSFHNTQWSKCIDEIIEKSKRGFGIEHGKVEASLYKLLIYEEGDFFLSHRDSEKEKGMFATLIVGLPSRHSGGKLIVKHSGVEHEYDFSLDSLKYHDRPRAQALLQACKEAGYDACLGLVTYYQMGSLDGVDYGYYDYNYDYGESDGIMGEVYEDSLYIENWAKTTTPGLGRLEITKKNLLSSVDWDNDEPIQKFEEGFTGNAGMTIEYFYHYGALIFWHKKYEIHLLKACKKEVQLEWLDYYTGLANDDKENYYKNNSKNLLSLIINDPIDTYYLPENCNAISKTLILLKDKDLLRDAFRSLLFHMFTKIDIDKWLGLIKIYPLPEFSDFFKKIREEGEDSHVAHYLDILYTLSLYGSEHMKYGPFIQKELKELPYTIETAKKTKNDKKTQIRIIYLSLCLSENKTDQLWVERTLETIVHKASRTYVNDTLCQALSQYHKTTGKAQGMLAAQLRAFCIGSLEERVANKPSPPGNWTRPIPVKGDQYEEWKLLSAFMASPTEHVFELKKNQEYRERMERIIKHSSVNLTCETIRKGSPYTLKLTKNQNSYEKSMREWERDVELLKTI
ncbi:MAG: hypothetical protein MI921_10035 [Cytophagales bacterium]|nr:hypothetical protein [Cytophagales bacterium]